MAAKGVSVDAGGKTSGAIATRKKIIWNDRDATQPEHWSANLTLPGRSVSAEYFVGNRFVKFEQMDATPIGTLMRLHKSEGVNAFWVLLSDTIASSLILLSL